MEFLIIICILGALMLLWLSSRQQKKLGMPAGRLVYTDTSQWMPVEKPLYAASLGLTGKPDYLIQQDKHMIPVEVKTCRQIPGAPFDSHVYQLAAYCVLVDQVYGKRPPQGVIHYTTSRGETQNFTIPFTTQLETAVLEVIDEIQNASLRHEIDRSHQHAARCGGCGYRSTCNQALGNPPK
jgi:CRISPR-associated exonuclease Cas4